MDELQRQTSELQVAVADALERIGFAKLLERKNAVDQLVLAPDFWNDTEAAQKVVKEQASLEKRLQPWVSLKQSVDDAVELLALGDKSIEVEVASQVKTAEETFAELKEELKFSGLYDDHDVIMSLHAGAGGALS